MTNTYTILTWRCDFITPEWTCCYRLRTWSREPAMIQSITHSHPGFVEWPMTLVKVQHFCHPTVYEHSWEQPNTYRGYPA